MGFQDALATHTDIFIPVLEIDPTSPVVGQEIKITTVVTNKGNADKFNVQLSFSLDGTWILDDVRINAPAHKSVRASFSTVIPIDPGQHQLKVCPERKSLGDDGHQCQTLDFVAASESSAAVAILSPKDGEKLNGNTTIKVAALGQDVNRVELYILNTLLDTKYQAPFDFTFDTSKYEDGKYSMYAIAYYESGIAKPSSIKKYIIDNKGSLIVKALPGQSQEAEARVGQVVVIESDVTNYQTFKIAATFILLIRNSDGFTELLSWTEGRIPVNETLPLSQSWVPEAAGRYDIDIFLWDTIENPVPLADVSKADVVVS